MRKIKWGVLGTADIARGCTIPGMKLAKNCELYAIAGRSMEKAVSYKEEFGFEKAYDDYDALLSDPQVEAVYIPLPNQLHYEWVLKAVKAKKHVLCEKPLAPTPELIEEMIQAANANGVVLMEAFAYLHSPIMQALKAELRSGVIGDVRYLETAFITSDYDISNIRMRKETCGGAAYDLGCYNTSQILYLLEKEPVRVQAIAEFSEEQVDMLTSAIMSFEDGCRAAFTCGMVLATEQDKRLDRLQIHGTKGSIKSDTEFNQCGETTYVVTVDGKETVKTVQMPQNYCLEVEQLGRCITDGEQPHVSHEFTMKNSRILAKVLNAIGY